MLPSAGSPKETLLLFSSLKFTNLIEILTCKGHVTSNTLGVHLAGEPVGEAQQQGLCRDKA